jgi:hypothetical protein
LSIALQPVASARPPLFVFQSVDPSSVLTKSPHSPVHFRRTNPLVRGSLVVRCESTVIALALDLLHFADAEWDGGSFHCRVVGVTFLFGRGRVGKRRLHCFLSRTKRRGFWHRVSIFRAQVSNLLFITRADYALTERNLHLCFSRNELQLAPVTRGGNLVSWKRAG